MTYEEFKTTLSGLIESESFKRPKEYRDYARANSELELPVFPAIEFPEEWEGWTIFRAALIENRNQD